MTDLSDRKNSVTRQDFIETAQPGGVWVWQVYDVGAGQSPIPELPRHGDPTRDLILAGTLDLEDMWASAVNKALTKIAVRGYEISDSDDSTRRVESSKALIRDLDGPAEYRSGIAKTSLDFLLCDNGWFLEIERVSKSPNSRPRALYHLDSFRCYRTGNLDYPVLYWDYLGQWHKLRRDQVIFGSDMPSPRARMFNKGRCAASRAFTTIITIAGMKTYFREKITGSRALALYFVSGLSGKQLKDAMVSSEEEKNRRGHVVYKGAVMVPIEGDQPVNVATVDLAGVADGFDVDQVTKDGYRTYALAIGLNPDELIERAAGLNSGQSAQVAENAAEEAGGLPFFIKDLEDKLNYLLMPKTTTFVIKTNDLRDQKAKADLDAVKATTIMTLLGGGQAPGVISQPMALQLAVDENLVPPEFLPEDATPGGVSTDSGDQSKPVSPTLPAPYAGIQPALPAPVPTMKAATINDETVAEMKRILVDLKAKDDDEWKEAVKWAEEASK